MLEIYESMEALSPDLHQGDILGRAAALQSILRKYHPYYVDNTDNTHFIVLTQTCDLVRRNGSNCSARYITLAPIKSLSRIVSREISESVELEVSGKIFCSERKKSQLDMLLRRLLNNNEEEYFFLGSSPSNSFPEDACAILRLGISIKAEHYEALLDARMFGLQSIFRTKLGWHIGKIYSRVGTPDWDEKALSKKVKETIGESATWMSERDLKKFKENVKTWMNDNPEKDLNDKDLLNILKESRRDRKAETLKFILEELRNKTDLSIEQIDALISDFGRSQVFTAILK